MKRFEPHSHTHYSNFRLLDSINKPQQLIDRAVEIGLSGIAITDHETVASHIEVNQYAQKIAEEHPDFKVALGNEIYLCGTREKNQKYFHFILIAKNKIGQRALRELSSIAWMQSFHDRGMERVVTTYQDLANIVQKYPNSLIATSACLGGELSSTTMELIDAETLNNQNEIDKKHKRIVDFILWCKELFGEDFYIECAPGASREQIMCNIRLLSIAKAFDVKMVIGTDAHYLKDEDRYVHEAYLNSKSGEREVASFYEYAYLQTEEEIKKNLEPSIVDEYETMCNNSMEIWEKIENYDLTHKQIIPKVEVKDYPKPLSLMGDVMENNYPILCEMTRSDDKIERYWVNECLNKLNEIGEGLNPVYLERLEEEADIKKTIGEKLETNMFAYPVTLQHYVDMFWECGSTVGAGRGSSCSGLNHYLLGVTQLDPIKWDLPFWRYLNKERVELGDIDLDLCPSKRPMILDKIKEERGQNFKEDIDDISRQNLGCTLIATYGTESTKSTVLTACRGYRSEEYPEGINSDVAQYLSSLVPEERGFVWSLKDVLEGNEEKGRRPVKAFIKEVENYPGLVSIMKGIEGLVNKRSSHASGVIMFDEDPYEFGCFMKTPKGEIITQYDLHKCEAAGMTKYDFLLTKFQDKVVKTIELLQENGEIDKNLTLREVYEKYLHPSVLPIEDEKMWKSLHNNEVLDVFQFDSPVGAQAAKKIKPTTILEMSDSNGLMRLMTAEKGEETPMEKYIRFKNNIDLWYREMENNGLTEEEQKVLEPYFKISYGVPPSQEQMMMILMDKDICGFSLKDANEARKIVGKKQMEKIPYLRDKVLKTAKSECLGRYVWKYGIGPQMGYSFSKIHALAYSFIGFQALYLANHWNPIYWNTACLIVNSGGLEDAAKQQTNYGKIARALSTIIDKGIKVSLVDINNSDYGFKPNLATNEILFGMNALRGVNKEIVDNIKANRPYVSLKDFMNRCPCNKTIMISLIKSGAFDSLCAELASDAGTNPRFAAMVYYLSTTCNPKKRITLQNFNGLAQEGLLPKEFKPQQDVYYLTKKLRKQKFEDYYILTPQDEEIFKEYLDLENLEVVHGYPAITQSKWDNKYKAVMDVARDYFKEHQSELLTELNAALFQKEWAKYAVPASLSKWEMDSLCFYYHEHELEHINYDKYGLIDFNSLSEEPEIERTFRKNNRNIPIYRLYKIAGTVVDKNDSRSTVSLLTVDGLITVKFTKDYYAMFNKQLSEMQDDGRKKIVEKGWFTRGTKILCTGYRRGDMFITKTYANTPTHQIYKIDNVEANGDIQITHERYAV